MRFNPKSEEELQHANLLQPGIYRFEVIQAKERYSRSGNEMIELQLRIYSPEGGERIVFDYLLEAMGFKLRHFAKFCGLLEKYESGVLHAEDCIGKVGNLELIIQQGQPKIDGGYYPDKNSVKDYTDAQEAAQFSTPLPVTASHELLNDAIPF